MYECIMNEDDHHATSQHTASETPPSSLSLALSRTRGLLEGERKEGRGEERRGGAAIKEGRGIGREGGGKVIDARN